MDITPKVAALDAAWFLVYTSGNLRTPKAATRLKNAPMIINKAMRTLIISITIKDNPLFQIFGEGNCADKGEDSNEQNNLQKRICLHKNRG